MNKNTNKWAVEVGNENLSEAIQTIAFSYGYKWNVGGQKVDWTTERYLTFDPDTKAIKYGSYRGDVEITCCQIVSTFDDVMKLFKTPPTKDLVIGDFRISKTGDVTLGQIFIPANEFDKVASERNKFMGKKGKLPVVQFTYTSQNSGRCLRNVIVTEMDGDYISGLDQDNDNKFKKYLTSKVSGTVRFVGFVEA